MRDTIWNGTLQKMTFDDGMAKGMRKVLEERGVDVSGMKADDMRKKFKEMSDYKYEKTKVAYQPKAPDVFLSLNITVNSNPYGGMRRGAQEVIVTRGP